MGAERWFQSEHVDGLKECRKRLVRAMGCQLSVDGPDFAKDKEEV